MSEMKSCTNPDCTCVNPQPLSNFANSKNTKDDLSHHCRVCKSQNHFKTKNLKNDFLQMTNHEKCTTIAWMYINRKSIKFLMKFFDLTEQLIVDVLVYEEVYEYVICNECNKLKSFSDYTRRGDKAVQPKCKNCNAKRDKIDKKDLISFKTYQPLIYKYEKIRDNGNDILEVRCTYCGIWYKPTREQVRARLKAINGQFIGNAENRLYCSDNCKKECPVFRVKTVTLMRIDAINAGHIKSLELTREVQPELRQMVFARDNYTCLKCKTHQNNLCVGLHCHHIEGIHWAPLESADVDSCMTVCRSCHVSIHKQPGCSYNDMKCPVEEMEVIQKK